MKYYNIKCFKILEYNGIRSLVLPSDNVDLGIQVMKEEGINDLTLTSPLGYNVNNIDFLKNHTFIEGVRVGNGDFDYSGIYYLHNLRFLLINRADKTPVNFSHFNNLERCIFFWRKNSDTLFDCLNLKELEVFFYDKKDLVSFSKLNLLTKLLINQSKIESLCGIEFLRELEYLGLNYLNKLSSLERLEYLNKLERIELDHCRNIKSISPLGKLYSLKDIK